MESTQHYWQKYQKAKQTILENMDENIYMIKKGDTLWAIAKRFGTTVEQIMRANPGINPNELGIGQKIFLS